MIYTILLLMYKYQFSIKKNVNLSSFLKWVDLNLN